MGLDWTTIWGMSSNQDIQMICIALHECFGLCSNGLSCWDTISWMLGWKLDARPCGWCHQGGSPFLGSWMALQFSISFQLQVPVVWFTSQILHRKKEHSPHCWANFYLWQGMSPQLHVHNLRSHHDKRVPWSRMMIKLGSGLIWTRATWVQVTATVSLSMRHQLSKT